MALPTLATRLALAAFVLLPIAAAAQRTDTIVKNAGAPRYAGISTLVEELSIGVVDGAEEYMFGDVADIALAKDGSIYVLDRKINGVRMYDANGKYLRTIGRQGAGPGEVASPSGIGVLPDGRLLLWDSGNWRINVYSATGAVLTHWSMVIPGAGSGSSMMSRALVVDTAGAVYAMRGAFVRPADGTRPRVDYRWFRLRTTDGAIVDTIAEPRWPRAPRLLSAVSGGSSVSINVPFDPSHLWKISPLGYIVSGLPDRYAFELRGPGRAITSVRRDVRPEPVSSAERDSARTAIETRLRSVDPAWGWGGVELPRTKPLYTNLFVGLDGRIWVPRIAEADAPVANMSFGRGGGGAGAGAPRPAPQPTNVKPPKPHPALYDVFEPSGAFIGQVQIPPRVSSFVRRGDYVWGVAYDEDDVAFVKRYRIVWR